jgi:hypothetical protein
VSRSRFERRFWSFSQRCDSPNLPDLSVFGQPEEPLAIELRIYGNSGKRGFAEQKWCLMKKVSSLCSLI